MIELKERLPKPTHVDERLPARKRQADSRPQTLS
jgi:hypothetical protein